MKDSEAKKELCAHIEYLKHNWKPHPDYDVLEAINIAINALEKHIPKKPNTAIDSSWGIKKEVHVCPVCDCYLTEVHFIGVYKIESNKKVTFCENCGQAIDWSDTD